MKEKTTLLLESPEKLELYNLRNQICPDNSESLLLVEYENLKRKEQKEEELKNNFKNKLVFTEEEILSECLKFNLTFVNSKSFKGEIDLNLIKKIKDFIAENNLVVSEYEFSTKLFILGEIDSSTRKKDTRYHKDLGVKKDSKPLFFFKLEEKNGDTYYLLIDGNKKYNSLKNRILGYKNYSFYNEFHFSFNFLALFTAIITSLFFNPYILLSEIIPGTLISLFLILLASTLRIAFKSDYESKNGKLFGYTNKSVILETCFLYFLNSALIVFSFFFLLNLNIKNYGDFSFNKDKTKSITIKKAKEELKEQFEPNGKDWEVKEEYVLNIKSGTIFPSFTKTNIIYKYYFNN